MNQEKNINLGEYISIKQAAKLLNINPITLRRWDKAGKLIAYRHPFNNYRLYKKADLEALLKQIGG